MHIAELLVPESSHFEFEITIAHLKSYKSPGSDEIPAEVIEAGGEKLRPEIYKLINSIWNKKEFPDQWKEPIITPIYIKGNYSGITLLSTS
jgi:hypothetical protein